MEKILSKMSKARQEILRKEMANVFWTKTAESIYRENLQRIVKFLNYKSNCILKQIEIRDHYHMILVKHLFQLNRRKISQQILKKIEHQMK